MNYRVELKDEKNLIYYLISIFILISVYLIDLYEYHSIVVVNDEFGYWGIAAYFSGMSWKDLFASTPYYSYGYSLLMVPFYLLNFKPEVMYQVMLIINMLLIIMSFTFSLKCYDELCKDNNYNLKLKYVICVVISFYANNIIQAHIAWPETLLYTLVWLLLYIFIKNIKNMSYKNTIAGAIVAIYIYIVHQRSVGLILVYYALLFVIAVLKNKEYKKYSVMVLIFVALFLAHSLIKDNIVNVLFTNDSLVTMNNIGGQTSKIKNILTTFSGAGKFIQSFVGKFYYASVATLYIFPIALIGLLCSIKSEVRYYIRYKVIDLKDRIFIYSYIILSFLALLTITAISMYINLGRLDLLIYGRYMEMAIGPILLIGMIELNQNENIEKYVLPSITIIMVSSVVVDYGLIEADTDVFNSLCATTLTYFFDTKTGVPGLAYIIAIITIIPLIIFYICTKKGKRKVGLLIFGIAWMFLASFSGPKSQQKYIRDNVVPIVKEIELGGDDISNIYFIQKDGVTDESQTYIKYLQYYLPESNIEILSDSEMEQIVLEKSSCIICGRDLKISEKISESYNTEIRTMKLRLLVEK